MASLVVLPLLCLPAMLILHWIGARLTPSGLSQRAVAKLAAYTCVALSLAAWFLFPATPGTEKIHITAYVLLVASSLSYSYFHVFNMALTARRVQLLILQCEPTSIHNDPVALEQAYSAEAMIAMRLQRLQALGSVTEYNGLLHAKWGFLLAAALLLEQMRRLFYGRSSTGREERE